MNLEKKWNLVIENCYQDISGAVKTVLQCEVMVIYIEQS